jgi:hypothetical protein
MVSLNAHGHALEACLFARQIIENLRLKPFPLCIAEVHAEQHLGPILGFRAACPGVDGQDGIPRVILFKEEGLKFALGQLPLEGGDGLFEVGADRFAFRGELR